MATPIITNRSLGGIKAWQTRLSNGGGISPEHRKKIGDGNRGKKVSEEAKQKMSLAKKGKPSWNKGLKGVMTAWNKGKTGIYSNETINKIKEARKKQVFSNETRKKLSESNKGEKHWNWRGGSEVRFPNCLDCGEKLKSTHNKRCRKCEVIFKRGENSPSWKGGITPENHKIRTSIETRLWREAVFARDNWTCQKYFIRGEVLHCHHIKNFAQYPELRFAIDNGITLSKKAHKEFHHLYGRKNNTQEQLTEFLSLNK